MSKDNVPREWNTARTVITIAGIKGLWMPGFLVRGNCTKKIKGKGSRASNKYILRKRKVLTHASSPVWQQCQRWGGQRCPRHRWPRSAGCPAPSQTQSKPKAKRVHVADLVQTWNCEEENARPSFNLKLSLFPCSKVCHKAYASWA